MFAQLMYTARPTRRLSHLLRFSVEGSAARLQPGLMPRISENPKILAATPLREYICMPTGERKLEEDASAACGFVWSSIFV
eukprot:4157043-Prymnesium_polylepis.1